MPKVKIIKEKCIGCCLCAEMCSKTFEMQGDKAIVKQEIVDDATDEKMAEEGCPTDAIEIS